MCTAIWKKIEISSKPSKLYVKVENEMISPELRAQSLLGKVGIIVV